MTKFVNGALAILLKPSPNLRSPSWPYDLLIGSPFNILLHTGTLHHPNDPI